MSRATVVKPRDVLVLSRADIYLFKTFQFQ